MNCRGCQKEIVETPPLTRTTIEWISTAPGVYFHPSCIFGVGSAAEVAASKPKRPSLEEIEGMLRSQGDGYPNGFNVAAADLIKALREDVVPKLIEFGESGVMKWGDGGDNWAKARLRALGEDVA